MKAELTSRQRSTLWRLVRAEAVRLGYGQQYSEWNRREWPKPLKDLAVIARKLRQNDTTRTDTKKEG